MPHRPCEDCYNVGDDSKLFSRSDGKCRQCHGSGYNLDPLSAFADSLVGLSQACNACNGTGECQVCDGEGLIHFWY